VCLLTLTGSTMVIKALLVLFDTKPLEIGAFFWPKFPIVLVGLIPVLVAATSAARRLACETSFSSGDECRVVMAHRVTQSSRDSLIVLYAV